MIVAWDSGSVGISAKDTAVLLSNLCNVMVGTWRALIEEGYSEELANTLVFKAIELADKECRGEAHEAV